jgi:hypothetical protein
LLGFASAIAKSCLEVLGGHRRFHRRARRDAPLKRDQVRKSEISTFK